MATQSCHPIVNWPTIQLPSVSGVDSKIGLEMARSSFPLLAAEREAAYSIAYAAIAFCCQVHEV